MYIQRTGRSTTGDARTSASHRLRLLVHPRDRGPHALRREVRIAAARDRRVRIGVAEHDPATMATAAADAAVSEDVGDHDVLTEPEGRSARSTVNYRREYRQLRNQAEDEMRE
jgi:hypothetical protein